MGKRQIAQMQPFDVVITLIIADLATIPMSDLTIPLLNGIVPLLVLTLFHFICTFIARKNSHIRNFINGKAVIIVDQNGIVEKNVKNLNMSITDVVEACRYAGYTSLKDVQYAIIETNGNVSVIPKSDSTPITRSDLKINQAQTPLSYILISDGKLIEHNLKIFNITKENLEQFLSEQGATILNVIVMQYDSQDNVFLQTKTNRISLVHKLGKM